MSKTKHYIDGNEVNEDELDCYECNHCGTNIKDHEYGFREDAYGHLYCDSELECRNALIDNTDHIEYEAREE